MIIRVWGSASKRDRDNMTQPRNFSWFVEDKLAGMGYPMDSDIKYLKDQKITTLVNITQYEAEYTRVADAHNVTVHNISVMSFCPPNLDQMKLFIQILDSAKGAVGVHCAMGRGRTGTMLACYLIAKEGYSADDAIAETRKRRKCSIETRKQENAVYEFEKNFNGLSEES